MAAPVYTCMKLAVSFLLSYQVGGSVCNGAGTLHHELKEGLGTRYIVDCCGMFKVYKLQSSQLSYKRRHILFLQEETHTVLAVSACLVTK